jgi:hypothetical protein
VDTSYLGPSQTSTPTPPPTPTLTLTKCCLLERGVEFSDKSAVVPWGSNLDEVRSALRRLTGVDNPGEAFDQAGDQDLDQDLDQVIVG